MSARREETAVESAQKVTARATKMRKRRRRKTSWPLQDSEG